MSNNKFHPPVGNSWDDFYNKWYIASFFGEPRSSYIHSGDDFNLKSGGDSDLGEPVYAIADGDVIGIDNNSRVGFGKQVYYKIEFQGRKFYIGNNHLLDIVVKSGQKIKAGDLIGHVGKSGTKFAHIHFSIKNTANGMDNVPNSREELKQWEDPSEILNEMYKLNGETDMVETIKVELKDWKRARKSMDIVEQIHRLLGLSEDHIDIGKDPYFKEIVRLQSKEIDHNNHKCPECPEVPVIKPSDKLHLTEKIIVVKNGGKTTTEKYTV